MTTFRAASVVAICIVSFIAHPSIEAPKKLGFCEVVSSPEVFDKRVIETDIVLESSEHALGAYGIACVPTEKRDTMAQAFLPSSWNSTRIGKRLESLLKHDHRAKVTVVGTFYASGGPFGPDVAPFLLQIERLISVDKLPKAKRNQNVALVTHPIFPRTGSYDGSFVPELALLRNHLPGGRWIAAAVAV